MDDGRAGRLMIAGLLTSIVPLRAAHAQELTVPAASPRVAGQRTADSADLRPVAYNAGKDMDGSNEGIRLYAGTWSYVLKVLIGYLTPPAPQSIHRDLSGSPSQRSYSATDAPAEERADPFRQLELIQRNRALAAKPHSAGNQASGK